MLLFFPLLQRLGYGMSWQGAVVASWGGLRGAVGLALAIVMKTELHNKPGGNKEDKKNGLRIIIYTAITCLGTLLVNATTTGPIVRWLGLTAESKVEQKAMRNARRTLQEHSEEELEKLQDEIEWKKYYKTDERIKVWEEWIYHKLTLLNGRDFQNLHAAKLKRYGKSAANIFMVEKEPGGSSEPPSPEPITRSYKSRSDNGHAELTDAHSATPSTGHGEDDAVAGSMIGKIAGGSTSMAIGSLGKKHLKSIITKVGSRPAPAASHELSPLLASLAVALHRERREQVTTAVHMQNHRERVTFVRTTFCRHLKLRYDNLVRTQLQGHPALAIQLRASVDGAADPRPCPPACRPHT